MNFRSLFVDKDKLVMVNMELAMALDSLDEAIILNQLNYWIERNKDANRNFHDGYYWVYNSYESWKKQDFPVWSATKIKRIFTSLEGKGIVLSANYNKLAIDKTKWYTIDYKKLKEFIKEYLTGQNETQKDQNEIPKDTGDQPIDQNDQTLGQSEIPLPETNNRDYNTENTNRDYIQETTNSFSNEKDNSQETWESNNSRTEEYESHISMSLGVKQKAKETPLKDMPTRAKEIADKLVDRTELSDGVYDCIEYFLEKYKAKNRKEHLPLRNDTLQRVVETMLSSITVPHYENLENKFQTIFYPLVCFMTDWEDRKEVIDQYFDTEFNYIDEDENGKEKKIEVDYSLVHFAHADVITHIMQKCYIGTDIEWYESEHVN